MPAPTAAQIETGGPAASAVSLVDPGQAARFRAQGFWRERTYLDEFDDAVAADPDKVASITHRHDDPDRRDVISYRQLDRLVDRYAAALLELGVQPGQVVSVQLPNVSRFAALALACGRIGAVINPLVPIFRERELTFILGRTQSPVLIVAGTFRGYDHAAMADRVLADLPAGTRAFAVDTQAPVGRVQPFEAHFEHVRWEDRVSTADLRRNQVGPDDLAELQFTSGTTGEPKGVMHTPNTIYAGTRAFADGVGLTAQDSILMPSTLAHQTGFLVGIILPLAAGMKVVYQDVWDPETFCRLADDEQLTFSAGATPFLTDIVATCQRRDRRMASMRAYVCAGAPIPSPLVEATRADAIGSLVAVWGMTENGAVTFTAPDDPVALVADSDGTPVPWMAVRIVGDAGDEVPVGGVGRLLVRGASQTIGYFKRPDLYQAQLQAATDGGGDWFDTGDLARRRPDGGIRIAGRTKDLVIRGGENVPVVEVEAVLFGHPKVREIAVIGYPDARLGERACAVVVPEEGAEPPALEDLTAFLAQTGMAKQFWPERLEVVDAMPKTPSGKIQKFALRARFGAVG